MSEHTCTGCYGKRKSIAEVESEIRHMLNVAQKRPGTLQAQNSIARIPLLKARLKLNRDELARHLDGWAS